MFPAEYQRAPLPTSREPSRPATSSGPPVSTKSEAKHAVPAASEAEPAARKRDPFFDNAKYLTIVLVVCGHAWEPLTHDSRAASALYLALYAFHMPAFTIISGYLSRSFEGRPGQLKRLLTGVAVPYLVFEVVYTLFMRWADNPDRSFDLLSPGYALWFLVALFIWRLTAPLWKVVRWPLPIALGIAALASTSPDVGDVVALQRVLQFLPFFVLGLQLRPEHFEMLRRRGAKPLAMAVIAAAVVMGYWATTRMTHKWFLHDSAAGEMGAPWWAGIVMTPALFGCAVALTAAFFALVPRRAMWFTALGAGTLYAYLLHVYFIKTARLRDWYDMAWVDAPAGRILVTLIAVALATVLCTPLVQRVFRFLMEPKLDWAFRRDVAAARERAKAGERAGSGEPVKSGERVGSGQRAGSGSN